jgi:hypothetical protein
MAYNLSPVAGAAAQFFTDDGVPLSGGKIFTYLSGTTTPATTYTTSAGDVPHTNPIILDSAGRVPTGEVWVDGSIRYKFVIKTSTDVLIGTYDNLSGLPSAGTQSQVVATQGQTIFTGLVYTTGNFSLSVFVNGSRQIPGLNYAETNTTTVTFYTGLNAGDVVEFLQ